MKKNAFVLSGGGSRGAYELGVWQALRELGIPIHIAAGTSVGALNGAMVAQDDFELAVRLWNELETHMVFDLDEKKEKHQLCKMGIHISYTVLCSIYCVFINTTDIYIL